MTHSHVLSRIRIRPTSRGDYLVVSETGDYMFMPFEKIQGLIEGGGLSISERAQYQSKMFFVSRNTKSGHTRLAISRGLTRKSTVMKGPSLHIIVPTLQCEHSCQYCQVSRSLTASGVSMSEETVDLASMSIFDSPAETLTVEYQGGDPLLRFDLIRRSIEAIGMRNRTERRSIRFVIASTLHQLTPNMCEFFKRFDVVLSTSIDGPPDIHNRNRPMPGRDSYSRTVSGVELARKIMGHDSVSALMTTTVRSLKFPDQIVDEYVDLGFSDIVLRPCSPYGFAKKNRGTISVELRDYLTFFKSGLERVLHWNRQGVPLREGTTAIALNKILSSEDAGYVDLQSPSGAGLGALVYNYDGYVYPSDESRMLAESGDRTLRLGKIGSPLANLMNTDVMRDIVRNSLVGYVPGCRDCVYAPFCGPDVIEAQNRFSSMSAPVAWTSHCNRQLWLYDYLFERLRNPDDYLTEIAYSWAGPQWTLGIPDA